MSLARKCTRCNELYEDYYSNKNAGEGHNALITIDRRLDDNYHPKKTIDLCPSCKQSFDAWFKDNSSYKATVFVVQKRIDGDVSVVAVFDDQAKATQCVNRAEYGNYYIVKWKVE